MGGIVPRFKALDALFIPLLLRAPIGVVPASSPSDSQSQETWAAELMEEHSQGGFSVGFVVEVEVVEPLGGHQESDPVGRERLDLNLVFTPSVQAAP